MAETPDYSDYDVDELPSTNGVDEPTPVDAPNVTNGVYEPTTVDAPNDTNAEGLWWSNGLQRLVSEDKDPAAQCKRNAAG
eukprot:15952271-Heterocapsa_arctica.AAC.1